MENSLKIDLESLTPEQFRALNREDLPDFADQVRNFLISTISKTGGHIGANLGTIELSTCLHHCFNSPDDAFIFDTGHIGYTHKIITGRASSFDSLNTYGGMSRFVSRDESEHDFVEASHAGTSISLALGRAISMRNRGLPHWSVAFIGDGALAEGSALEALNHASVEENIRLLIVLNDNGYAISPGFGAIHDYLQDRSIGDVNSDTLFKSLGYEVVGPIDGHSTSQILESLDQIKQSSNVCLLHAKTEKGRGLELAKDHPYKLHFSFPFDTSGVQNQSSPPPPAYQDIAALAISDCMEKDPSVVSITPSTLYATGLADVFARYPDRCFDPGMQEQHAVSMAVGMSLSGLRPVLFYQSTFLQRAFDQLIHDVCFSNQNIVILTVRSGFAGYDNPTHHGIYDLSYLRCLPNLKVYYPRDSRELYSMTYHAISSPNGPTLIHMPYGPADNSLLSRNESVCNMDAPEQIKYGEDGLILTVGNKVTECESAIEILRLDKKFFGLVNIRRLKPLPEEALLELVASAPNLITVEEGVLEGGFGSAVSSFLHKHRIATPLLQIGLPCSFIEAGSNSELCEKYLLNASGIARQISAWGLNR